MAIEFALAGPVLLLLVFIVLESGLMLFAQSVLDNATRLASRQVMIGAVRDSATFQSVLCGGVSPFLDCTKLNFVVQSGAAFPASASLPNAAGVFPNSVFSTGSAGQYVLVEVAYDRNAVVPWIASIGGNWILLSTTAFQNEPFL